MTFADVGINIPAGASGQFKMLCSRCSHTRKKTTEKCLSVNLDDLTWFCHNPTCNWNGGVKGKSMDKIYRRPEKPPAPAANQEAIAFFVERGISPAVMERNKVGSEPGKIGFPYIKNNIHVNTKWRKLGEKKFYQEKDCEKVFYKYDDVTDEAIICEGELDALSFEVAGRPDAISVPDGAPAPGSALKTKMSYMENCAEMLEKLEKVYIATDSDEPGRYLAQELVRRIGAEKCWMIKWPHGCKDANEVLMAHGAEALAKLVDEAVPCPVEGLFHLSAFEVAFDDLYLNGYKPGLSTGWNNVDEHFLPRLGELTVVTGRPGAGKSTWLDALLVNMARMHGWRSAIFSPENQPIERHAAGILTKYIGKPFNKGFTDRMTPDEYMDGKGWLADHFYYILPDEDMSIVAILESARVAVLKWGISALVIDPWNTITQTRGAMSEADYVSYAVGLLSMFAKKHNVHVFLVAHPQKLHRDPKTGEYPVPDLYMISGGANFANKVDNGISIWRDLTERQSLVEVHVLKVRWREVGTPGIGKLTHDTVNGRYADGQGY